MLPSISKPAHELEGRQWRWAQRTKGCQARLPVQGLKSDLIASTGLSVVTICTAPNLHGGLGTVPCRSSKQKVALRCFC